MSTTQQASWKERGMRIEDATFPKTTFGDFFEFHGIVVTVRERAGEFGPMRYYARCDAVEVKESDGLLCGLVGNGATREAAVLNYARRLAGRRIVVDAWLPTRRVLQCPNEWEG